MLSMFGIPTTIMPKDLPGFYWDAGRNRYFPLSSKPPTLDIAFSNEASPLKKRKIDKKATNNKAGRTHGNEEESDSDAERPDLPSCTHMKRRQGMHPWSLDQMANLQPPWDWVSRERITRDILSSHIGATSRLNYNNAPASGKITTFCTYHGEDQSDSPGRWHLLGDARGWLFRCKASYPDRPNGEELSQSDSDIHRLVIHWLPWSAELNLQPNGCVSSISMWGSRWVATGAGSSARFASSDIRSLDRMFMVTLPAARDLWASHLRERSVAFGASFRAIYIPDIDHSTSPEQLNTSSDVFTVVQDQHLIYTGSRNGAIHRFDKRVGFGRRGDLLLDARFSGDWAHGSNGNRSSVLNLSLLGGADEDPSYSDAVVSRSMEPGLLVSQMNGQLQTFDLRFVSTKSTDRGTQPLVCYEGHINNHTRELGLAIDYTNGFLYAAGQDCRIRGWSLTSGESIIPTPLPSSPSSSSSLSTQTTASTRPVPLYSNSTTPSPTFTRPISQPWAHFNPFLAQFSDPIPVLRVSADDPDIIGKSNGNGGSCLWAASGESDLWRWSLGQRNHNRVIR